MVLGLSAFSGVCATVLLAFVHPNVTYYVLGTNCTFKNYYHHYSHERLFDLILFDFIFNRICYGHTVHLLVDGFFKSEIFFTHP